MDQDQEWISSLELADALDVTSSTVRQDLSWLRISGTAKRGYRTEELISSITSLLGRDGGSNMVIVGAGNLGRALAVHEEFTRQGFAIRGIFDAAPRVVGRKLGSLVIQRMDELPRVVRERSVDIGVIAVPTHAAQGVADLLVAAGVQGVLNMSVAHVRTPESVPVVEARMFSSLSLLSYAIKARRGGSRERKGDSSCRVT
jgi:redox-sensing transcriptional repressor